MILVIDPDEAFATRIATILDTVDRVRRADDPDAGEAALEDVASEVELIALGPGLNIDDGLEVAGKLRERYPEIALVMGVRTSSSSVLRVAMRAGVNDVVSDQSDDDEIREVIERAAELTRRLRPRTRAEGQDEVSIRRTVTVFSTKGGSGKSLLATNIAVLLAEENPNEVVLVDLDLQAGDVAVMLQLMPAWSIHDAATKGAHLDEEELRGYLTDQPNKLKVLTAPTHPSQAEDITPDSVVLILQLLKKMFRFVVVDGPPLFTEAILAAMDETDIVLLVASMDVPSIKNLKLAVQTLDQLGFSRDQVRLVINRADSKVGLTLREVEKSIGQRIDGTIPSSREVPFSINQGMPVVVDRPKSPVSRSILDLLDVIRPRPLTAGGDERKRWFGAGSS